MAVRSWTLGADGNWGLAGNWSGNEFPVAGDTADISTAFTISASDADDAAAVVNISVDGAELVVEGTMTVGTIDLTAGALNAEGEITGGTTIDFNNNATFLPNGGTFDGVTWKGTLALDALGVTDSLVVTTGLNVLDTAGTGPGVIDINGPGSGTSADMDFESSMTLNGTGGTLAINIGAATTQGQYLSIGSGVILTLGTAASLNQIAAGSTINLSDTGGDSGGTIVNDGLMSFTSGTGSGAFVNPSNFVNNGTISLVGGGGPTFAGEDLELTPLNSFTDGATGKITVSDFGFVHIQGPNGSVDISGTIAISGTSTVDLDTASVAISDKSGTGVVQVSTGSTIQIDYDYAGSVIFLDATGTLALGQSGGAYTGSVIGMSAINSGTHDSIDLLLTNSVTTLDPVFTSTSGGTLIVLDNTTTLAAISMIGNYVGQAFTFASDGQSTPGTDIFLGCFTAGSRILTERGEVPVESLREGDLAITLLGSGAASKPVRWIGVARIDLDHHPRPETVTPIRILAGAFGDNLPRRDLLLSPDHAVYVDGALIPIHYLINGTTIHRDAMSGVVTYYHVELDAHDVLVANGLPAESYLDTGSRVNFANGGGVRALYPEFVARRWESEACAPLIVTGPVLCAVRDRVNSRVPAVTPAFVPAARVSRRA